MYRFFDEHLKGMDTGLRAEDPIHYFTINAAAGGSSPGSRNAPATGVWRSSKQWPVDGTSPTTYYLRGKSAAGGDLQPRAPDGAGMRTEFTVRYDLDCPGVVKRPDGLLTGAPPCPQPQGGPQFTTRALIADTEITGDPVASIWISSTATDGNIHVYLEDVAADGSSTAVTDGRLKASLRKLDVPPYEDFSLPWHRSRAEDAQPLVVGEPAQLVFNILPTSYVFKSGHRIRVSFAGYDYRERDRTPVSPPPIITLYDTPAHPSFVILPVIKRRTG
jgi:putative CocE/NonD family hydrolase